MEQNKGGTSLWLLPYGERASRAASRAAARRTEIPRGRPKGDRIAFLAKREQEGRKDSERQLYVISAKGGEAQRKSDFAPGIDDSNGCPTGAASCSSRGCGRA